MDPSVYRNQYVDTFEAASEYNSKLTTLHWNTVFHQFFEGLALGSRIALLEWKPGHAWKRWMMCGLFGVRLEMALSVLFCSSHALVLTFR